MTGRKKLSPDHLDMLKEIGNIGAGHAATALSKLLGKPIVLHIPSAAVASAADISMNDAEKHVAVSCIRVNHEMNGQFFMLFEVGQANRIVRELVPDGSVFDGGMGESAFCEISNILCGSYLSALSSFLGVTLTQAPPSLAIDMEGAILGEGLAELFLYDDSVFVMEAHLYDRESHDEWKCECLFLPSRESMDVLFNKLEGKLAP
ncbi:chemotaxis protein CheC [Sporolactobacillus sp. THM7-7]|nr:chemotaxis protein CheC [Sporolactobacillus sp. THM7-7]